MTSMGVLNWTLLILKDKVEVNNVVPTKFAYCSSELVKIENVKYFAYF